MEAGRVRGARPTDNLATLQNSLRVIIYEHIRATAPSLPSKESRDMLAEKLKLEGQYTVSAVAETLFSSDYDYGWAQDLVISLGEKLSCLSMVAILQDLVRIPRSTVSAALTAAQNRMSKQNMWIYRLSYRDLLPPRPRTSYTPNWRS